MELRSATTADAADISALIHELSHLFLARSGSKEAIAFHEATSVQRIAEYIAGPNRIYVVARVGAELAGFISLKDRSRVSQFFVCPHRQGKGVGRRLWNEALARVGADEASSFTVDSSRSAVPVYERFGFKVAGPVTEQGGVVFVPMRREPSPNDA